LETKRSSLLMALDAAGVEVEEVLQDGTLRQHAITSHETLQRKRIEEYETRKAQENVGIQAEAERVAAEYAARISRNLDELAREKDNLRKWQTKKQYEAQRIADAMECLTKSDAPTSKSKPPADRMAAFRDLAAAYDDPAFRHRS
jgi:ribosomal protein L12E/L44/L45/RPP1/RPP2